MASSQEKIVGSAEDPEFDRTPFELESEPISKGWKSWVQGIKSNPDKVLRETKINDWVETSEAVHEHAVAQAVFKDLRERYGVDALHSDMLVGQKKKGERHVFNVVDRVQGKTVEELEALPEQEAAELDDFLEKLLRAMLDSYKNRAPFYFDFAPRNIVYGHRTREKDAKDNFLISDVGVEGVMHRVERERNYKESFYGNLVANMKAMEGLEKKFGEDVKLSKARDKLKEMYKYCLENEKEWADYYLTPDVISEEQLEEYR